MWYSIFSSIFYSFAVLQILFEVQYLLAPRENFLKLYENKARSLGNMKWDSHNQLKEFTVFILVRSILFYWLVIGAFFSHLAFLFILAWGMDLLLTYMSVRSKTLSKSIKYHVVDSVLMIILMGLILYAKFF